MPAQAASVASDAWLIFGFNDCQALLISAAIIDARLALTGSKRKPTCLLSKHGKYTVVGQ